MAAPMDPDKEARVKAAMMVSLPSTYLEAPFSPLIPYPLLTKEHRKSLAMVVWKAYLWMIAGGMNQEDLVVRTPSINVPRWPNSHANPQLLETCGRVRCSQTQHDFNYTSSR